MKGKHGAAAAVRHEVQTAAQQIETYKAAVARLTAELKEAKAANVRQSEGHRKVERELLARVDAGTSAKTEALEMALRQVKEDRDLAKRRLASEKKTNMQTLMDLIEMLRQHGVTLDAITKANAFIEMRSLHAGHVHAEVSDHMSKVQSVLEMKRQHGHSRAVAAGVAK